MVHLLLGIHNHQPVGNFDEVLEKAFQSSYRPFLDTLERHPGIRLGVHFSGVLYEWLAARHPDLLNRLAEFARQGRVELLGGGFYEPIIASLPEKDQRGQIEAMRHYLKQRFGIEATGFWLAERVWEPQLPKVLARSGVGYTVVDDTHFLSVGFSESELKGYFLTEAEGKELRVFPISQRLRYMIPYSSPEEVIEYLREADRAQPEGSPALVMADDGEKFGLWPDTFERVYQQGWLERFFSLIEENASWLRSSTFSEYLRQHPPLGWAYLPTTSYAELSEWALGPESSGELKRVLHDASPASRRFLRGGYFRNFLTKYPEANRLYRKMLRVSEKVHALESPRLRGKVAPEAIRQALGHLWRGQCNCAYWHGVFGGLYLPHLRNAVYENLLKAERVVSRAQNEAGRKPQAFSVSFEDWDADGEPETLVEDENANWYFAPNKGAGLWEWDLKEVGVNACGVVSRRREAYHERIGEAVSHSSGGARTIHEGTRAKQGNLGAELFYDWHGRMSLLDHFLHPDTRRQDFASARYGEQGDFVLGRYRSEKPSCKDGRFRLAFERDGTVWAHSQALAIRVRKEVELNPDGSWRCLYTLYNRGSSEAHLWFGSELALAFSTPQICPAAEESGVELKSYRDAPLKLSLRLAIDSPSDLWSFPLYTISQSEEGFERTYQGSVVLLHRRWVLGPGQSQDWGFGVEAGPL